MISALSISYATVMIGALVAAVVALAVVGVCKRRKNGGCSCGCSSCDKQCKKYREKDR